MNEKSNIILNISDIFSENRIWDNKTIQLMIIKNAIDQKKVSWFS